jgi:ferredoxin
MSGITDLSDLESCLSEHGLLVLGFVEEGLRVLIGNAGSGMWPIFKKSQEYQDGLPHPLDRWTRRLGAKIARESGAGVIFPFDGPPYPPFQSWAEQSGEVSRSPIALSMHRRFGLWHAYRFALLLAKPLPGLTHGKSGESPCLSCSHQNCLRACPVGAFTDGAYRVRDCVDYLGEKKHTFCRQSGCAARHACPVAGEYSYEPDHAQFHMDAFVTSQAS